MLSEDPDKDMSGDEESPSRAEEEEEDMDVPIKELEEDIPLAKTDYTVAPAYPPIQVQVGAPLYLVPSHSMFSTTWLPIQCPSPGSFLFRLRDW